MAELRKILSYPANDIDKILQQGIYSVANDTERDALALAIKTTNRTVYVRSTGAFYVWNGTVWEEIGAQVDIDNVTITENASGEIQAVGLMTSEGAVTGDSILEDISNKQDTLVNQQNIKSVNNETLLGSGNLDIPTYLSFPNSWTTNATMVDLFTDIENDATAVVGKAYLGEVTCSDLPFSGNAELVVEIMNGSGTNKIILASLTSSNVAPYYWQYTYGGGHNSGWQTFISADNNIPAFNANTSYTEGDLVTYAGIFYKCINAHTGSWIAADFTRVNLKDLFDLKQDTITGAASSVTTNNLTASKVLVSDTNGKIAVGDLDTTQLASLLVANTITWHEEDEEQQEELEEEPQEE